MSRYIRLEYSEQQQAFHFAYTHEPEESNGYVTIEDKITRIRALAFIDDVRKANHKVGNERLTVEFIINFK